jgi:acyl-CoA synthetase (NDP forming)
MAANVELPWPHQPPGPVVGMSLDAVFEPTGVAVYGASARRRTALGNTLLANVAAAGLSVTVVHPSAAGIDGHATVPSLRGASSGVDLALVSVPARSAPAAIADAAASGASAAVVLSSGFAEAGPEGRTLESQMLEFARQAGMSLIGPNCMGVISRLSFGALLNGSYFWDVPDRVGGLSFVSQSGAMGGMFLDQVRRRSAGLARFVSIGNAADVGVADALAWLADDSATTAIGMFVEGIGDGPSFVDAARRAASAKPVIALKGGRHATGAKAAASHTGSLAGRYGPVRAAFLRAGIVETTSTQDFFDHMFTTDLPRPAGPRVAIVTVSGGPSVVAADAITDYGLALAELAPLTRATLRRHVPPFAAVGNPVDVTPQCRPDDMADAIGAVYDDDQVDAVVAIDCGLDVPEFGRAIAQSVERTGLPTVAYLLDVPAVAEAIRRVGVPEVDSPERAVAALAAAVRRAT